jgi:hypothetical protein
LFSQCCHLPIHVLGTCKDVKEKTIRYKYLTTCSFEEGKENWEKYDGIEKKEKLKTQS